MCRGASHIGSDHGRLKARLRPMRSLKTTPFGTGDHGGHTFVQNLRRAYYELGVDIDRRYRLQGKHDRKRIP
jgi:hypothetical protein